MKKSLIIILAIILLLSFVGCSASEKTDVNSNDTSAAADAKEYNGEVTDLSKQFLSTGYIVNMYRYSTPHGDGEDSFGKNYITMQFGIIAEYISTADFNEEADYNIKSTTVSNVKVLSTSKMGTVTELAIMERYSSSLEDPHVSIESEKSKYVEEQETPHTSGGQIQIIVELGQIALYDVTKSEVAKSMDQPTLGDIYNELGVTRDDVELTIGFRLELETVSRKTLYRDYEITIPPVGIDIAGNEFNFRFIEENTSQMEPFLEK